MGRILVKWFIGAFLVGIVAMLLSPHAETMTHYPVSAEDAALIKDLPLSRYYLPLSALRDLDEAGREKRDPKGIVMTDYTKYGIGWQYNPEAISRTAIRALNSFLENRKERFFHVFISHCAWLVDNLEDSITNLSLWFYDFDYKVNSVYDLSGPWASAMAQGQEIAALVRAYFITGNLIYLNAATKVLKAFYLEVPKGGVRRSLGKGA